MKEGFRALFAQMDMVEAKYRAHINRWLWAASLIVLCVTTIYWSFMGSLVHMENADNLVDPRLFESYDIFRGAVFPGAHSFLLKWPVFWLIALFQHSNVAFYAAGLLMVGSLVAIVVWLVTRVERRPLVRSMLVLALASILLTVPAQPYPGALLPVNLAMLASRNLEYAFFIGAIWLVVSRRQRWATALAAGLLAVLFASDKLFVGLALGAAVAGALYGLLLRKKNMLRVAGRLGVLALVSFIVATALIRVINLSGVTTITDGDRVSPYSMETEPLKLLKATLYAGSGVLTNFGAQPVDDSSVVAEGVSAIIREILHPGLLAHLVNFGLCMTACYGVWWLLAKHRADTREYHVLILLFGAALAAVGVFVLTDHYHIVDARYLTMTFFALYWGLVVFVSKHHVSKQLATGLILLLVASVIFGVIDTARTTTRSLAAGEPIRARNEKIVGLMAENDVARLIGDYWRVFPIQHMAGNLAITPLASCQEEREVLASKAWNANGRPYALLLSKDKGQTDFPACSYDDSIAAWGRPTEVLSVTSTEKLLIYR